MKKRRLTAIVFGIMAVAWAGLLFFFSGQSGADSSSLSREVARMIARWFPGLGMGPADIEPGLRKLAHFGIFAVEGFFAGTALTCALGYAKGAALSVGACVLMAVANEFHQRFSVGRSCEFRDMLIDSGGALLGVAAALLSVMIAENIIRKKSRRAYVTVNLNEYRTGENK